jgi:hypothetical protein
MKNKQVLIIRQKPETAQVNIQDKEKCRIKSCCCIDKGESQLWTTFKQNQYSPHDIAEATIFIDNEKCKLDVTEIKFYLKQVIDIKPKGSH